MDQSGGDDVPGGLTARGRRAVAASALLAVVLVGFLLLRGDGYTVNARFAAATQMVKGNVVRMSGVQVGTVREIRLADDGEAELELAIDDAHAPLRKGTQVALRLPSLSSAAGRYVDLIVPDGRDTDTLPDGATIPATSTSSATDLDHLFSLFDKRTRRGLREFIRGQAAAYGGRGEEIAQGWLYLSPSLVASERLFREVNRDTPELQRFLAAQSRLVTDLADRPDDLSRLVDRLATATGAIARQERSLTRAVGLLPPFLREANTTFVGLRDTLDTVAPLVEESKPVAPLLRQVLGELRPLARDAVPTVRDLADDVARGGARNDLTDLARAVPAFRDIAVGPVNRNGKERPGAFPTGAESLEKSRKNLAFFRPYAVDFTGWLDDFSHSGVYDGNGSLSRSAISVNAPSILQGLLGQVLPANLVDKVATSVIRSKQRSRCPGSMERGAVWKPSPEFNCDATQVPVGK